MVRMGSTVALVAFPLFLIVRVAFFQYRIWYLRRMRVRWVATVCNTADAQYIRDEDLPQLRRALLEADVGIEAVKWPVAQPAGYGFVAQREMTLLDNLCVPNDDVAKAASAKWGEAIGAYRLKRNDTLNPIRWFIKFWHLPKAIASFVGADADAWPVRLIQLVYQAGVVGGLLVQAWHQWSSVLT